MNKVYIKFFVLLKIAFSPLLRIFLVENPTHFTLGNYVVSVASVIILSSELLDYRLSPTPLVTIPSNHLHVKFPVTCGGRHVFWSPKPSLLQIMLDKTT